MLTSLQNSLVKQLRKLHRAKERREQQRLLLEGTHLLQEALAVGFPLETVCATPEWQQQHPDLWNQLLEQASRVELVSHEVLQAIATTVEPDGIVATAGFAPTAQPQIASLGLMLETIQDPGNLGAIIRTAAAVGVDGLWLSADSVDPAHPKVMRASAGQWFRLSMGVSLDLETEIRSCQQQGIQVVATLPQAQTTYWDLNFRHPTLILLGNEGAGLSRGLTALADTAVTIPLHPGVESLNVGITAALMLYEVQRQRRPAYSARPD